MTQGPYNLPEGRRWVRLREVCVRIWSLGQSQSHWSPVLRSTDFLPHGGLSYKTAIRLALTEKQLKKSYATA
jgi:hypothetical protein